MHVFKDSFRHVFDCDDSGYLTLGFNAKIEVFCSQEFKCSGAIGGLTSLSKHSSAVSEVSIGAGGTCQWVAGSLDRNTTIGVYFDIPNVDTSLHGKQAYLQFQTAYLHPSGRKRLRVTTIATRFANPQMS